jgi:CRISPR-associated protein Csb3
MSTPTPSLSVNVDVTNPGQFFACCGLLELAHRLQPGAEGWFELESEGPTFAINYSNHAMQHSLTVIDELRTCRIEGLSEEDRQERDRLEARKRDLKKNRQVLSKQEEERRKVLGTTAREGVLSIGTPFSLRLDWWQTHDDDLTTVKTWAGRQEVHKVARAAQDALHEITALESLFNHACVLRCPEEYRKKKSDQNTAVEPFYFDARRFAHRLDTGFSLDVQDAETLAHPAVELLCVIGLQRFRPTSSSRKWVFEYSTWSQPLPAPVAAAVVCGALSDNAGRQYQFRFLFRDDQRRYKAFDFATLIGGKR